MGELRIAYSCVDGDTVWPGQGNINGDPRLLTLGQWQECDSPSGEGCFPYQWSPDTGEPTSWRRWLIDYHLRPDSPAIDAGTSEGAPTTDFEGHGRPCGLGVDIGAYEFADCPAPSERFRRGDGDGNGAIQISDPIRTLSYLFLAGEPPPCSDAADSDDSGDLDITDAIYILSFQFLGGPAPKSPFPGCGIDEWMDALDCKAYLGCQ